MNSVPATLILAGIWGSVLGLAYFGGLWLTVRRLPSSPRPGRLWGLSFAFRLALLLLGVWPMLLQARVTPLAPFVGIAAILLMRLLLTRRLAPQRDRRADA